LGEPWPPQEREERFCKARVRRGTKPLYIYKLKPETRTCPGQELDKSGPGARHVQLARDVRAIGQICPMKTTSVVLKTSETTQKIDIQRILA
jgi:hypothetical protein